MRKLEKNKECVNEGNRNEEDVKEETRKKQGMRE